MKKLLIILLFPTIVFTQTKKQLPDTCFTQQELADISFVLDSLWTADDINNNLIKSYDTAFRTQSMLIKLDSVQLQYKNYYNQNGMIKKVYGMAQDFYQH